MTYISDGNRTKVASREMGAVVNRNRDFSLNLFGFSDSAFSYTNRCSSLDQEFTFDGLVDTLLKSGSNRQKSHFWGPGIGVPCLNYFLLSRHRINRSQRLIAQNTHIRETHKYRAIKRAARDTIHMHWKLNNIWMIRDGRKISKDSHTRADQRIDRWLHFRSVERSSDRIGVTAIIDKLKKRKTSDNSLYRH